MNENDFSKLGWKHGDAQIAQTVIILRGVMFAAHRVMGKEREAALQDAMTEVNWLAQNPAFLSPPSGKREDS